MSLRWLSDRLFRPALAVVAVLLTALALAACGGGGSDEADVAGERVERETTRSAAATRVGGELRLAWSSPLTLDPVLVTDADSARFIVEIFGGLLTLDRNLNVAPDLAEALPTERLNEDGTVTYRFVLRRDALFHNGRRVTATDVQGSIERAASRETLSSTAPDFLGDIVGLREFNRGRSDELLGVTVVDERTIEITIDGPKPFFLAKMTHPVFFVVDLQQIANDPRNWAETPNATGPFRVQRWDQGEQMILVPFDRYHLGPAQVEQVRIRFAGGGLTQYENDEVDIAVVSINDIERVRDPADPLNAEFITRDELSIGYIGLNVKQPPFDDPLVRLAFAMAIDKVTLIEVVLMEALQAAYGILPPGIPAADPDFLGVPFDPVRAKALLEQSSYSGRIPEIRITTSGVGATPGTVIEAIRDMWKQHLGVEVEIQQAERASFFSEVDRGLYQAFDIGWIADYPDAENFLDILFHSSSLQNNTGYANPEVDALVEAARVEQDREQRTRLYREAERIIIEDVPWIPLFFGRANEVVKPYVEGYQPPRMVAPHLRYITLSD